jgi:hypothetical protein
MKFFFSYITARISYIRRDDDGVCFVLDQYNEFDLYSDCSLKQQSVGIDVGPLGHIILIPSQPVFALTPYFFSLLLNKGSNPRSNSPDSNHYTTHEAYLVFKSTFTNI